jgi:excisionase family DNA binding protein
MATDSDDPWLTVAEIAEELRLAPATIRTWIADGTLQAKRAGKRKWLVRRSELDRMLHGEDYADATPLPAPDPADRPPRRRLRRAPDFVSDRSWPSGEYEVDAEQSLPVAEWEWRVAVSTSQDAPPDRWFPGRLQHIARAATRKAGVLARLDDGEEIWWDDERLDAERGLSHELRPGGRRPGPPDLWEEFDRRVTKLGAATEAGRAGAIRSALNDVAVTLHDIAEDLERYRGSYGEWLPHPPEEFGGEAADRADQDPPATDESVS